jgi:hypothetical protein
MALNILAALGGRDGLRQFVGLARDAARSRAQLIAENALLRQQLLVLRRQVGRPRLTPGDRWWMVVAARFARGWQQALLIVQPATLLRWHREMYRRWWTWRSKARRNASSTLAPETIALIREMADANRLWGAERKAPFGRGEQRVHGPRGARRAGDGPRSQGIAPSPAFGAACSGWRERCLQHLGP